jgi:O-antigen/teichoic acid export membrane protein
MSAFAVVAANALLARLLSPREMGAYFLALSIVTLGALLGSLGMNQAIVRFVAEATGLGRYGQTRQVMRAVFGVGALGALGVGGMYALSGPLLGSAVFHAPALVAVTGLVAVWMVAMTLQTLLAEAFRGLRDIRFATVFGGLAAWALLVPCLVLLWSLRDRVDLGTVVLLSAATTFASVLLAGWLLYRKVSSLPKQGIEGGNARLGNVLRVAWPMLVTNLTLFAVTQADLWIVGAFRPQTEVAIYGAAVKLVILVAMPLQIANAVVPPLIAEMYAQGKRRELERTLRLVATVAGIPAFLALVGFLLLGAPLLGLIYGDYYRAAWTVLALLSLGQLFNVWVGSCGMVLTMTGHQVTMMVLTVVSGMLTVGVGLLVVGRYGTTGVAAATAVGIALQQMLLWLAARSTTGIWTHATLSRGTRRGPA